MAGTKVEMPPLHVADSLAAGVGGGGGGGTTSSSTSATTTTISAAADSSDNQPSTPQPVGANEQQQQQLNQSQQPSHHPYATHHMYASSANSANSGNLPHMYSGMYATGPASTDLQQQQLAGAGYPSYLNSYESSYYQQPPTTLAGMDYGNGGGGGSSASSNSSSMLYGNASGGGSTGDFKPLQPGVRYHPYLHTPTSGLHANNGGTNNSASASNGQHQILSHGAGNSITSPQHHLDEQSAASTPNSANGAAVSTTTSLSPRVVSSSSPSSTSQQQQQQQHHANSPSCTQLQCKKCGIMCTNEAELSAHFANMHGGGSGGANSSPYGTAPYGSGQQQGTQQQSAGGNPGEILDLDSQKMVYPPTPGEYQQIHAGASSDPLHSMHSMQQRALASWEQPTQQQQQQQQEGLPPYLQSDHKSVTQPPLANQSPYYSPKQSSPFHSIKSEYPIIKTEYAADSQNYVDKSFDPTAANELSCQQQGLLPVSSSPAEFPSTTTTPQQDQQQQQQYRAQFEPPTSSSILPASSITAKAATWKSNEARRPKTYNCTACNKWFTSSGHLKRHYNTTLHKNAVKSSGQPDPATLPISAHHHPARDPTAKQSRRVKVDAAAREQQQQQQQVPAPVQPPEPPRSPPEYASAQGASLAALSHYSTSPSPTLHGQVNGMSYGQTQQQSGANNNTFQQQYLQQVQATASNAAGASNATVLNGHPNGLAGPSVHQQQQQTLTSSQMRGLLNSTTTTIVTKSEPMEDQQQQQPQHSPMDMHMEMELTAEQQHQQQQQREQQDHQDMQLAEMEQVLQQQQQAYQLELEQQQQQQQQQRPFHSSTPSSTHSNSTHSMRAPSPHIISHQQYLEQLQQQQQQQPPQQQMEDNIFCHTPHTPASTHMQQQQLQQYSIMAEQQQYNITVLDTNTIPQQLRLQLPHNSSNMSPPLPHTTTTTATISSMDSIRTMPHSQQLQRPLHHLHPHIMPNTLLHNSTSNTLEPQQQLPPLDTIRNTIHTLTTTPSTPMPIPSFQQLQQQQAVPPEEALEVDHTMSYHTIIGKSYQQLHSSSSEQMLQLSSGQFEHYTQMLTTDGQLLQLIPTQQFLEQQLYRVGTTADSYAPLTPYSAQRSPQEGDLPPSEDDMQALESSSSALNGGVPHYSPTNSNCSTLTAPIDSYTNAVLLPAADSMMVADTHKAENELTLAPQKPKRNAPGSALKRKRNPSNSSNSISLNSGGDLLPSGRIKCQQCDKTFAKNCYLTQHINCFHAGEYPFRCEKCGKRFQLEEPYEVHLQRHKASEKAHKCHLCPKHYHHKTDLRRHIEGTHTQKKPHACEICDKSFCRYDHLLKHLDTHNRPRVVGKRSAAANNKIKAAFENAAQGVEIHDTIASSIDNVVSNSSGSNYDGAHIVQQVLHADVDGGIVVDCEDQKMLLNHVEPSDDHQGDETLHETGADEGNDAMYTLNHVEEIKQEYMVKQEVAIF